MGYIATNVRLGSSITALFAKRLQSKILINQSENCCESPKTTRDISMAPKVSSLFSAIEKNNLSKVRALLLQGVRINIANDKGLTPLRYAAWYGRDEIARLLLEKGGGEDKSELQRAVRDATIDNGHNVIPILQEYGAKMGLMEAMYLQDDELVNSFLSKGANVNEIEDGDPLIHHAIWSSANGTGTVNYLPLLLRLGADVNVQSKKDGYTALMIASKHGFTQSAKILLAHGANTNIQGNDGVRALNLATDREYHEIILLLTGSVATEDGF